MRLPAAIALVGSLLAARSNAGLFKIDFAANQNDADGVELTDWTTIPTWSFDEFDNGIATWPLVDSSTGGETDSDVTLTIMDNVALSEELGLDPPTGMIGNNPTHEAVDLVYDGINVPYVVKDDYLYRSPDTAGTELLFRIANLNPGRYNVTVFEGRTTDGNGQFGRIWVGNVDGSNAPQEPNTGDFAGTHLEDDGTRVVDPEGNPKTITVDISEGDYLWYAHMEDNSGGISGMIIRAVVPLVDTDNDGMPDDWETAYGLNPNDPADATLDCNNNGVSNLDEYKAGLDPCDKVPPSVVAAEGSGSLDTMKLTFSETLDAAGATNAANYSISPSLDVTAATYRNKVVTLTTAKQALATTYTITLKGLQDLSKNEIPDGTTATVNSYVLGRNGVLKLSYWGDATGGDSIGGATVNDLLSDPRYPDEPSLILPVYAFDSRGAFPDDTHENYGATLEGFLTPTESGDYTFFLRSDDGSQFWISSDDKPENLALVAEEVSCCQAFLEPDPDQGAAWHDNGSGIGQTTLTPISLKAGTNYFVRVIYKEAGGGDYGQVAWRKAGDTNIAARLKPVSAQFLSSTEDLPVPPAAAATGQPAELGQTVNGYQDDFTGATRDPGWVAVGPGGDHYVQTNGVLQVSVAHADPNHLIYTAPGASNTVQEVLARMRVVAFGTGDASRGGIAVGVMTNVTDHLADWIGVNINFRDHTGDVTPAPNRHLRMLDDLRSWGPQLNLAWTNNVWYWLRLRMDPKGDGVNDHFGKVWPADGTTAEPEDWQMKWVDTGTGAAPAVHGGFPAITGCSADGLAQTEVDYVLVKSSDLPSITVNFPEQGPAVNPPELKSITRGTNRVVVQWFGGALQSATAVTGPYNNLTANVASPSTNAASGTAKFFRVKQ